MSADASDSSGGNGAPPPAAPPPAPAPAAAPPAASPAKSSTSAADIIGSNAWLTAGFVFAYSSYALWVKLRKMVKKSKENVADEGSKEPPYMKEGECITHSIDESGSLLDQVTG